MTTRGGRRRGVQRAFRGLALLAGWVFLGMALFFSVRSSRGQTPAPHESASASASGSAHAAPKKHDGPPPASAQKVTVGLYVHHVNNVDLRSNTFLADFYVWFRWKGDIDPTKSFELRNA